MWSQTCSTVVFHLCCGSKDVQWRVLFPQSDLLLRLCTFALPQPQHQIREKLSRAHAFTFHPSSSPPPAAISDERARSRSPHASGNTSDQRGQGVSQSRLPPRGRGGGASAQVAGDGRRLAEIARRRAPPAPPLQLTWGAGRNAPVCLRSRSWSLLGGGGTTTCLIT